MQNAKCEIENDTGSSAGGGDDGRGGVEWSGGDGGTRVRSGRPLAKVSRGSVLPDSQLMFGKDLFRGGRGAGNRPSLESHPFAFRRTSANPVSGPRIAISGSTSFRGSRAGAMNTYYGMVVTTLHRRGFLADRNDVVPCAIELSGSPIVGNVSRLTRWNGKSRRWRRYRGTASLRLGEARLQFGDAVLKLLQAILYLSDLLLTRCLWLLAVIQSPREWGESRQEGTSRENEHHEKSSRHDISPDHQEARSFCERTVHPILFREMVRRTRAILTPGCSPSLKPACLHRPARGLRWKIGVGPSHV